MIDGNGSLGSSGTRMPNGWCWSTVGMITENHDGRRVPVKSEDRAKRIGEFHYYGASGVIDTIDDFLFDGEFLLIAEDGANLLSRSTPIAFPARGRFWVNNHAHVVTLREEMPLAYLEHYLNWINVQFYCTGTAQPKLNQVNLNRIPCPIAPLQEQRRIVTKLDELFSDLDAGVAALKRAKANLKRYRASVLKAAVEGKLTAEWRAKNPQVEPASELLARILKERRRNWEAEQIAAFERAGKKPTSGWQSKYKEPQPPDTSNLPELPVGWCWACIDQVSSVITKGSSPNWQGFDYIPEGTLFLRSQNVRWGGLDLQEAVYVAEAFADLHPSSIINEGDVLLNLVGASVGRAALATSEVHGATLNQAVSIIRPIENGVLAKALVWILLSPLLQTYITKTKTDVARANFNLDDVRPTPIPFAPLREQQELLSQIELQLSAADRQLTAVNDAIVRASRLRQSILKQAFEGKLVPQDASDEPASVLLERIQAQKNEHNNTATTRKTKDSRAVKRSAMSST